MKQSPKYLLILLALVLALSGCGIVKVDEEKDNQQIVVEFTGGSITKGEAMKEYNALVEQYALYGITDKSQLEQLKPDLLNYLAEEQIVMLKAKELGLFESSDEEKAEITAEAEASYSDAIDQYKDFYKTDDMTDDEAREATEKMFAEEGYTVDSIVEYELSNAWQTRLREEMTKDVQFTEEDIKGEFDEHVASDGAQYGSDPAAFEAAMEAGELVTWYPEGYITEKHILIPYTSEQLQQLDTLNNEITSIENDIEDIDTELASTSDQDEPEEDEAEGIDTGVDPDVAEDDGTESEEDAALTPAELSEKRAELETQKADYESQKETLKTQFVAELQSTIDEVMAKLDAGEDFDQLMDEYNADEAMATEPAKTQGQYISAQTTDKEKVIVDAAMALTQVGSTGVSEPGDKGVYIVKYLADVPSGPVDIETVRAQIEEEVLAALKDEHYANMVEQWVEAANVKIYAERMK